MWINCGEFCRRARGIPVVGTSFVVLAFAFFIGCKSGNGDSNSKNVLRVASTTSVRDSGLMDELLPIFERKNHCRVDLIAVGTGAAIKLAEQGDVDALICHAEAAEKLFMDAGHGTRDDQFMHNFYLIVGPKSDPAGISGLDPVHAYKKLVGTNATFISRGDDSGTHKKEMAIRQSANVEQKWENYIETGQGQGQTLIIADEKDAYTLTNFGSWLRLKKNLRLVALVENQDSLKNPYSVLVVDPEKHSAINEVLANGFADFLVSREAQELIGNYRIDGQPLFIPVRVNEKIDQ